MTEDKQVVSYEFRFKGSPDGEIHGPEGPFFRPRTRLEKFKLAILGFLGFSVLLTILSVAFFVSLILAVPLIIGGLFWYWKMSRAMRRNFGRPPF